MASLDRPYEEFRGLIDLRARRSTPLDDGDIFGRAPLESVTLATGFHARSSCRSRLLSLLPCWDLGSPFSSEAVPSQQRRRNCRRHLPSWTSRHCDSPSPPCLLKLPRP